MADTPQLGHWRGALGDSYTERNRPNDDSDAGLARGWASMLSHLPAQPRSILEVGSNVGRNLRALARITTAELWAVEPNENARREVAACGLLPPERVLDGHAGALPFGDRSMDLVFTSGVLIHVPDGAIDLAYDELYRVARRWILSIEYFAPLTAAIEYRDRADLLWKRDYGGLWVDRRPDLQLVDYGFLWRRVTPFDDANWWLFAKPG